MNDLDPEDWLGFEQLVLPHIDAAFNLARWLLRSRADGMSLKKPYFARVASSAVFTVAIPIECPQGPEATTILTLTTHISEEIDPAQADAKTVDRLLHVYIPMQNNHTSPREDS